jgi:predicted DNA-binding transcriptional regulator AlpA
MQHPNSTDDGLMTATHVRNHFGGISEMTLWRWMRAEGMNFPQPIMIQRRRFWRRADIAAFEARQTGAQAA